VTAFRQAFEMCVRLVLADFAFERPVTATIADITGARRGKVSPTILAIVMARYEGRVLFMSKLAS